MSQSTAESVLSKISSSRIKTEIDESYDEPENSLKALGRPTNNMLLSVVHAETKRTADEITRLNSSVLRLENKFNDLTSMVSQLCVLIEQQNDILSSNGHTENINNVTRKGQTPAGTQWYYQGTSLKTKYHLYACVLIHLMNMVQVYIDQMEKHYPDSMDCEIKTLQNAIRIVCTERCQIKSVEFKQKIITREKDSQPFDIIYPYVSSQNSKDPSTLPESMISKIFNPITRPIMQDIEWIRQRLVHLHGILSVRQIDILKSMKHPFKVDGEDELIWDKTKINPKPSHPLSRDIVDLKGTQKNQYIKLIMSGKSVADAYHEALESTDSEK